MALSVGERRVALGQALRTSAPKEAPMKRVSPYSKMRVLGAIELAPGDSTVARIRHVVDERPRPEACMLDPTGSPPSQGPSKRRPSTFASTRGWN